MSLLQKYLFVPLDIFRKIQQNKDIKIENKLEAWLAFLCMDEPEIIIEIIEKYPEFIAFYKQVYAICQNIEGVMNMFSEELRELDRNTVQLMIDEMQEELEEAKRLRDNALNQRDEAFKQRDNAFKQRDDAFKQRDDALKQLETINANV